jgi:biopolymer transport protein ExbB
MLPTILANGGVMFWVILFTGAVGVVTFIERYLHCHRAQINATEFLNGVRTVLKRNNVVEALSICDATPGPVPRVVKAAILHRDQDRERIREAIEQAGADEVPRLEEKLNLIATVAQIAPLMGLLGTMLGFIELFHSLKALGLYAQVGSLSGGIERALVNAAAGIAVAIPAHASYNYLVSRINKIVLDMERVAAEILNIVTEPVSEPADVT